MNTYSLYEPNTGRISGHVSGMQPPEQPHVVGDYDSELYLVRGGKVVKSPRPPFVVTPNRIGEIPSGSEVIWGGAATDRAIVDDGIVEFDLVQGQRLFVTVLVPGKPIYTLEVTP